MPIQGFTRARKHQLSRQAVFGTVVPATRAYPKSGVPSVNLGWTDPDVDTGSIVPTVAPTRGASDLTFPATDPALAYNNAVALMCAMFGGAVSPSSTAGTGRVWSHKPSAVSPLDEPDVFTYEWGDDVLSDWFQFGDGILESLTLTGPEGLGPITTSESWRLASVASTGSTDSPVSGTVPTPDLAVDVNPAYIYLKDMGLYIADNVAGLGAGLIDNALHNFVMTITKVVDQKRFANADQSFDIDAYGVTGFNIDLALTLAKTDDTVGTGSEADAWFSDDAVDRYARLAFTGLTFVGGSTPYSWVMEMPLRYYTRDDGESGGNTTVTLTGHAFYDPDDFDGFFSSVLTTSLTEAELGLITS